MEGRMVREDKIIMSVKALRRMNRGSVGKYVMDRHEVLFVLGV